MTAIQPCKCGLRPEENTSLLGYRYSLCCRCGEGGEICYLARANNLEICIDNWNSLVTDAPFLHEVQELPDPHAPVVPIFREPFFWDRDPLRRYVREHGGFCSGGAGPS